jgi:hypothetical protein
MFSDNKATYCTALFGEDTVEMYVHCAFIVQYSMHMYTLFSIGSGHGSGLNHSKFTTLLYAVVYIGSMTSDWLYTAILEV